MWRKLFGGRERRRALDGLDDEIQDHLEHEIEVNIARGMSPEEARRQAHIAFGNVTLVQEDARAAWTWVWLEQLRQDVRYALRALRKTPGFATAAILTLSLGIGANSAIFTLINVLMLRPLPVPNADQLLQISMTPGAARESGVNDVHTSALSDSLSYPVVQALAEQSDLFEAVAGFSTFTFDAGPSDSIRRTPGALVTGAFYETMGLVPAAGRLLTREDDRAGAPLVAVITDGYWERAFARDPRILEQPYRVNGRAVTIVGVSPPGFTGAHVGWAADLTLPASAVTEVRPELSSLLEPGNIWLRVLARPRSGISRVGAEAGLASRWPGLAERAVSPSFTAERRAGIINARFTLRPGATGWTTLRDLFTRPLYVLMTLVGFVMLIACANVAGLLLARATTRQREVAIRFAIGASRGRLIRHLLTESTLLSLASAALGIVIAAFLSRQLLDLLSTGPLQVMFDLAADRRVIAFTVALALATAVLFGFAPAWHATAANALSVMKTAGGSVTRGLLLSSVVTVQVALCVVLLVGAGLFIRTLQNLRALDAGFQHEGVLLVDVSGQRPPSFYRDVLDVIRTLPGVTSASVATNTPLSGSGWSEEVTINDHKQEREPAFVAVSPGYFATLRTPVLRGRDFSQNDEAGAPRVAIVNQVFARRYLTGENPLGQRFSATVQRPAVDFEIVGVVSDVTGNDLRLAPPPTVYVPYFQVAVMSQNFSTLQVRTAGSPRALVEVIRQALLPSMRGSPIEIRSLTAQVDSASVRERLVTTLATGLGLMALTLASIGLYGLLAYGVAARAKEIGIRVALGAEPWSVVALVLRQGARPALAGIVIGIAGAAALSHLVEGMLFRLPPLDPATFVGVPVLLVVVALLSAFIPARHAARVDPLTTIKAE